MYTTIILNLNEQTHRARATELMGVDDAAMAERAWQAVLDNEHGHGRPLDDRLALIVMQRIGGWEAWDQVQVDDVHWWHDKFVKAYADSFGRQTAGMALPPGDDKAGALIGAVTAKLTGGNDGRKRLTRAPNANA